MRYGLIGKKLGHSFSPELHRLIGGYHYELMELPESLLAGFFTQREFDGINVTIPYKQSVLPYLDKIDSSASAIGAVNTVVNRQGKLYGYNTDFGGMIALIRRMGLDLRGKKVLILGTGGTAQTARACTGTLGAAEIHLVSRSNRGDALTYPEAMTQYADADILINATPVGMFPDADSCPIALSAFPQLCGVVDMVYNPLQTRLVLEARQRGILAEGGLYMLVAQAALASELFTGKSVPEAAVNAAYDALLRQKRNLVLIGMPGSGKTTVGREIARKLKSKFVDLDEIIQRRTGKTIPDIFVQDGETAFRDLETEAVRDVAGRSGIVIATGGGTVLRPENVNSLRQNGLLFLLDCPLDQLHPTEDRPLADTAQKLDKLYRQRMPLYRAAAYEIIETKTSVSETANAVIQRFYEV